jgi:(2Fe-2S) ferredoxin
MAAEPRMNRYGRHIFICTGHYCDPEGKAGALYARMAGMLGELGLYENPCRVKRGTTPCLGVCSGGPIVVVYPEGVWYHHVNEEVLERIVQQHLHEDMPVEEYIFYRMPEQDQP